MLYNKMVALSQLDSRWAWETINGTTLKIGRWGCLITSLCMLLSKYGIIMTPDRASDNWRFTREGLLMWRETVFAKGFQFIGRYREYDEKSLKSWLATPGCSAVVEVDGFHWLACDRFSPLGLGLQCIDPLGGKPVKPLKRYNKITGMAYFKFTP